MKEKRGNILTFLWTAPEDSIQSKPSARIVHKVRTLYALTSTTLHFRAHFCRLTHKVIFLIIAPHTNYYKPKNMVAFFGNLSIVASFY